MSQSESELDAGEGGWPVDQQCCLLDIVITPQVYTVLPSEVAQATLWPRGGGGGTGKRERRHREEAKKARAQRGRPELNKDKLSLRALRTEVLPLFTTPEPNNPWDPWVVAVGAHSL